MKHLYFVRHGLSLMNQQGFFSGLTDTPLTNEGRQQAIDAGKLLQTANVDCIVASPITRAFDTACLIATEIGYDSDNIITSDHFIERDFGPLEGTTYSPDLPLDTIDGVEHSRDLVERVALGLEFIKSLEADTILVVSHGAVGRALRYLVQDETPFHGSEKFLNGEVVKLI